MTTTETNLPRTAILQLDGVYNHTITTQEDLDYAKRCAKRWTDDGKHVVLRWVSDAKANEINRLIECRKATIMAPARARHDEATEEFKTAVGCHWQWKAYDAMHIAHEAFLQATEETFNIPVFVN